MTQQIIATVGTDHHPFARFVSWVAQAAAELPDTELFVQRGTMPAMPGIDGVDYLSAVDLEARMLAAVAVVCHGGPGTISLVRRCGHFPIVIARDPAHGEHIDDHQLRYCRRMESEGRIALVATYDDLVHHLEQALAGRRVAESDSADTVGAALRFGSLVGDLVAERIPPRPWRQRFLVRRTV